MEKECFYCKKKISLKKSKRWSANFCNFYCVRMFSSDIPFLPRKKKNITSFKFGFCDKCNDFASFEDIAKGVKLCEEHGIKYLTK